MAFLAFVTGLRSTRIEPTNFFADFAAYAQFLIALPLFVIAERVVSRSTREAARDFIATGIVSTDHLPQVDAAHREVERLRLAAVPEIICVALAYTLAYFTLRPEFRGEHLLTWHTAGRWPTAPGWWALVVALPLLNYWWLRIAWKVLIWARYLYRMSRIPLALVASHPDRTGGLGFVSEVEATFALVIFAYGISNVAAVIAYKVAVEGASPTVTPVWGPAAGFIVAAPLLFTLPLLMFTKQLYRTKRRALAKYREQVTLQTRRLESDWLAAPDTEPGAPPNLDQLNQLNQTSVLFDRIAHMRVVPFDWESAAQLLASTIGSVATALPLLKIEGPTKDWLEFLTKLLGK